MENKKFEQFVNEIETKVLSVLPAQYENAEVKIVKVTKTNDEVLTGLNVKKADSNIAPTVYLDDLYKMTESIDEALAKISEMIVKSDAETPAFDIDGFRDFKNVKDRIIPCLVNTEKNKKNLLGSEEIRYEDILVSRPVNDLSVIYRVIVGEGDGGIGSIKITNQMLTNWGVTEAEVHENAILNLVNEDYDLRTMQAVMAEMMGVSEDDIPYNPGPQMYVLSNKSKINGAGELLNQFAMEKATELIGDKFYILPSSLHEVLLVPEDTGDVATLTNMVREVNETQVAPQDFLSDTVYHYDKVNGLTIAA